MAMAPITESRENAFRRPAAVVSTVVSVVGILWILLVGTATCAPVQRVAPGIESQRTGVKADLQKDLRSPYLRTREKALDRLVRRGRSALPILVRFLDDPDHRLRGLAARGLARLALPEGRMALLRRLGTEKDPRLVDILAEALVSHGREAWAVLKSRARSGKATAVDLRAYQHFLWKYVLLFIQEILRRNTDAGGGFKGFYDGMFRDVAVLGPEAGDILLRMIRDKDRFTLSIRQFAIRAMAEVGNRSHIPALLKFHNRLRSESTAPFDDPMTRSASEPERILRTYARYVLARMGETGPCHEQIGCLEGEVRHWRGRRNFERAAVYQYDIAYEWHQVRNFDKALEVYQAYLKTYPGEVLTFMNDRHMAYYNMCCIESRRQNVSKALEYLERSFAENYTDFAWLDLDTDLDNIRDTPEFKKLVEAQRAKFMPESNPLKKKTEKKTEKKTGKR